MCALYQLRRYEMAMATFRAARMATTFEEFSHLKIDWTRISPSNQVPIIRINQSGVREISKATWGLVPHWSKKPPEKPPYNARCETVATNGMYRDAFARRRCLIPADGFYEGAKKKRSLVRRDDDTLFAFAGIYDFWNSGTEIIDTCAIITSEPNALIRPIHHRMPIILQEKNYELWLGPNSSKKELQILLSCRDEMEEYEIACIGDPESSKEESLFGGY